MKNELIREILNSEPDGRSAVINGWIRTKRETGGMIFIQVSDGSCPSHIQLAFEANKKFSDETAEALKRAATGAAVRAEGILVKSPAAGQAVEVSCSSLKILGDAPADSYPLQKKKHSFEFLRENAHLRARTNTFGAIARLRSQMAFATHTFFQENGFQYVHTPIITANDCEGAGEMFQVTTLDLERLAKGSGGVDYGKDFFGKPAKLTVSGQLEAETYAMALSRVYTFGPTFRAENSNTTRHLAEFWMIEPEMAFADLDEDMNVAEAYVKYLLNWALTKCGGDIAFFDKYVKNGLLERLSITAETPFARVSYGEAVKELEKNASNFEFAPYWGCDLQSEHEKYLTETIYKGPVIVTDYPKEIKAFYMKLNPDNKTVGAMDILVPGLGEIIGGSQREENYGVLKNRLEELGLRFEDYRWYLDLRKFGSAPHSGFGLGFERLMLYITGMTNIRDVIPYPRAPKLADF